MKKFRIISITIALTVLVAALSACSSAPELEDIKDELTALIEASAEVNEILFGEGLPVYSRDDEENENIYYGMVEALDGFELVRDESPYQTVEELEELAEKVYTSDYLEPVAEMVFVGYADEDVGVTAAKYYEYGGRLYRNMSFESYIDGERSYDYETMKIVKPSKAKYINVELESEKDGERRTVTLAFEKTDDGWRLDTPTY